MGGYNPRKPELLGAVYGLTKLIEEMDSVRDRARLQRASRLLKAAMADLNRTQVKKPGKTEE